MPSPWASAAAILPRPSELFPAQNLLRKSFRSNRYPPAGSGDCPAPLGLRAGAAGLWVSGPKQQPGSCENKAKKPCLCGGIPPSRGVNCMENIDGRTEPPSGYEVHPQEEAGPCAATTAGLALVLAGGGAVGLYVGVKVESAGLMLAGGFAAGGSLALFGLAGCLGMRWLTQLWRDRRAREETASLLQNESAGQGTVQAQV